MKQKRWNHFNVMIGITLLFGTLSAGAEPLQSFVFTKDAFLNGAILPTPVTDYALPDGENGVFLYGGDVSEGYRLTLRPGDAMFLMSVETIQNAQSPMILTLEYSLVEGSAEIAIIGLNSIDGIPDGQLGYTLVSAQAPETLKTVQRLHTIYTPPSGNVMGAVQAALADDAAGNATIIIYNFSVYPFSPAEINTIPTNPAGSFDAVSDSLITNINNDQGVVRQDADNKRVLLSVTGNGLAANAGVRAQGGETLAADTLLIGKADVSRLSGQDGMTAMVITNGDWSSGVFLDNKNVPQSPAFVQIMTGGLYQPSEEPLYAFVQNGGGENASETAMDNLILETFSLKSIIGLPEPISLQNNSALAATLMIPKKLYGGSQGSFSLVTTNINNHTPLSVPYSVKLIRGQENVLLDKGFTDSRGLAAKTFTVPKMVTGSWKIEVLTLGEAILSGDTTIQEGGVLFIETDKPIYKPSQMIQGRVLLMNNALAPLEGSVELSISDAEGIKIHRDTLTTNAYGVASFELPLANELNFGTWKIVARYGSEVQLEKDIEVDRYVLPAFEVDLNLEKSWFLVDERITGIVESRYFFGKPVQGNVHIEALRYVGSWQTYATVDARLEDGMYAFDLPPVEYIAGTAGEEGAGTLQLKITVTDDTGHEESADLIARIVEAGVAIQLISESPVIKPGLNQEVLIVTETPGGAPLSQAVELEVSFLKADGSSADPLRETIRTQNGLALYNLNVPEDTVMSNILARATLNGKTEEETLILNAVYSPGSHYIHLRQQNQETMNVGQQAEFTVYATNSGTVFYDVYANGRTVFSQASETRTIRFTVTPEMSPEARLVAYMIQPDNEVSVDVLPFQVTMAAPVNLTASFSAEEVRPGDPVTLSLQNEGQAMIGIALVDQSIFALAEGRLNLRNVFAELERIFMEPQAEVHSGDDPNVLPGRQINQTVSYGQKGAADILSENNLQMITSKMVTVPIAEPFDPWKFWMNPVFRGDFLFPVPEAVLDNEAAVGGGAAYQEPERTRTFFPETWLWQPELLTNENGFVSLDLTAPDSITTWKLHALSTSPGGLGITEGSLRVFQDFFVEPDLPYAVIRGDRFPLLVRVFNYVDQEQNIRITLEDAEGLGLQDESVQIITVPANGVAGATFTLEPTKVGVIPISLIAQSSQRADAIRKDLRVEPEGVRRNIVHNGILRDTTSVVIDLTLPTVTDLREPTENLPPFIEIVPDSEYYRVAVTPSLLGQSMQGLDELLGMPFGCGEQNMMFLAPDIEVLRYLRSTGQLATDIRAKAEYFITTGYQRQLTFRRNDGSFSAFGQQDDSGSLWLTAFVLSAFSNAREIRTIDSDVLASAANWIIGHQKNDGSWDPVGFVIHSEMVGGMNGNVGLTAFVANALLEYGDADPAVLEKALSFLEQNLTNESIDSYVLAQIAYALANAGRPSAEQAVGLLLQNSIADASGVHWSPHPIETTGYAILALMKTGRLIEAQPALEWMAMQRNHLGGFGNTQDTVLAFKSLTAAAINQSRDLNAQIDVLVDGQQIHTFNVNADNFDVLQAVEIASAKEIEIRQSGQGTVLFQVLQAYNVPVSIEPISPVMVLRVEYSSEHVAVDDIVDVNVYAHYFGAEQKTGMAIVDVSIPTGFVIVQESLDRVKEIKTISRIEQAGRKVIFYVDHFESGTPLKFTFQVKAKFPVRADSGSSSAYLYYNESTRAEAGGTQLVAE
ncbi:MAG: alpha-2-macroglobulin [Candidatus Omnitrophota bacterium]|jgi:CD109 antigen|nr:MAG: alpha-2-macroglobulin [Candidatus Omnitrophota bacterium]